MKEVEVFKNYLPKDECEEYASLIRDMGPENLDWSERTVDITNESIVERGSDFFKEKLNLDNVIKIDFGEKQ